MAERLAQRIAAAGHETLGEYLCALIQRDISKATEIQSLREKIAEGEASGIIDRDPDELIEEIIENRRARHDR